MSLSEITIHAEAYSKESKKSDFIFSYDYRLYRIKKLKNGQLRAKDICSGIPKFMGLENIGIENKKTWNYIFEIESKFHNKITLLLKPRQITSLYRFKTAIINKIPVIFSGGRSDFQMFIQSEFDNFDFNPYRE